MLKPTRHRRHPRLMYKLEEEVDVFLAGLGCLEVRGGELDQHLNFSRLERSKSFWLKANT